MNDHLREELVTLGQRLIFADTLRDEARAAIFKLWRQHQGELSVDEVAQWTTLSREEILRVTSSEPEAGSAETTLGNGSIGHDGGSHGDARTESVSNALRDRATGDDPAIPDKQIGRWKDDGGAIGAPS